jgi:sugar/nucleoside kinase (ribokinase family)
MVSRQQRRAALRRVEALDMEAHVARVARELRRRATFGVFVYHEHRTYKLPNFVPSRWVYLTSLGDGFQKIYPALARYLDRYKVSLGFNPGTFQLRKGPKANRLVLERTHLLSVNVEEAQSWVGDSGRDPELLCQKLMKLGPRAVALTDGRKGAYSYSDEGFFYTPEYPGPKVEATGAGDSFTTAYIAALAYGKPHREALLWGPVNAGSVVQQVGPQAGLLSRHQLETLIRGAGRNYRVTAITDQATKDRVAKLVAKKES